jgi:hypothetical protein
MRWFHVIFGSFREITEFTNQKECTLAPKVNNSSMTKQGQHKFIYIIFMLLCSCSVESKQQKKHANDTLTVLHHTHLNEVIAEDYFITQYLFLGNPIAHIKKHMNELIVDYNVRNDHNHHYFTWVDKMGVFHRLITGHNEDQNLTTVHYEINHPYIEKEALLNEYKINIIAVLNKKHGETSQTDTSSSSVTHHWFTEKGEKIELIYEPLNIQLNVSYIDSP